MLMRARILNAFLILCTLLLLSGALVASGQRQAAPEPGCVIPGIKDGAPVYFRLDPCPEVVSWTGPPLPSPAPSPSTSSVASLTPSPAPSAMASPSANSSLSPGAGPGGGIVVRPGESIQAAVDSAPAGATVLVRAGVYAESVSVPRPLTLAGEAGAILDGGCGLTHGVAIADIPDVTVQGLTIRHYRGSGVQVSGPDADRITVRGNDIHDFACAGGRNSTYAGVSFYYSGSHQRVVGNTIRFRAAATDRAGRVGGQNGVWFKSASGPGEASGGHHTVTDNVIVGGWDGIGGEGEDDPHGVWDGNATVLRNHVSDCHDDGISAEGFTGGSHFSDNTVVDCGLGFANASRRNSGEVRFERNVITSNAVGFYGNQACFKLGDGGTQTAYIVGNRCTLTVGDGLAQTNAGISTLVVTDNLWMTGRYVYEITSLPAGGSTFDRNCMATTDPTRFVKYGNARYLTLAEFQRAAGQEAHGRLGPCE